MRFRIHLFDLHFNQHQRQQQQRERRRRRRLKVAHRAGERKRLIINFVCFRGHKMNQTRVERITLESIFRLALRERLLRTSTRAWQKSPSASGLSIISSDRAGLSRIDIAQTDDFQAVSCRRMKQMLIDHLFHLHTEREKCPMHAAASAAPLAGIR